MERLSPIAYFAAVMAHNRLYFAPLTGEMVALARVLPAFAVTLVFALMAWGMGGVSVRGALAGFLCTFLIVLATGYGGFVTVLVVFALTVFATQFGLHRKFAAGIAECKGGRRGVQVLSNLSAAAMVAVPGIFFPRVAPLLFAAMTAALCEAAADTVSSEIGKAVARRSHLITNLQSVPAGTDGGITLQGTLAGIAAAWIVAAVAASLNVISDYWIFPAMISGVAGMMFDSVLGATIQRPGKLGNDSVNFISTAFAACATLGFGVWLLVG